MRTDNLQALGLTKAPAQYNPDSVWSYEIGEKARFFDQRLTVNADIYYLLWVGVQTQLALACGYGFNANAASAGVKGGEIEVNAKLTDAFTLTQNVGYTFPTYLHSVPAANIVEGQRLLDVPVWTISTILKFQHQLDANKSLFVLATNAFNSTSQDLTYTVNNLPSRDLTNIRFGLESSCWSASLFIDNVLNRQLSLANAPGFLGNMPSYQRVATNQPLTVGLELNAHY